MATKLNHTSGTYFLLFLTVFNFVALICITVYQVRYGISEKNVSPNAVFEEIRYELKQQARYRRSEDITEDITEDVQRLVEGLFNTKREQLLEECRQASKIEVLTLVKDAVHYITSEEPAEKTRRQTNTTGNELATIFGEIAKQEVGILTKYCGNNSQICLPGPKGDPGLHGIQGSKGERGVMGSQGSKRKVGTLGITGSKGEPGVIGPDRKMGLSGIQGLKGAKGDSGVLPGPPCCTSLGVPEFSTQVQEILVTEGSNVTMTCDPTGYPPPRLTWKPTPPGFVQPRTNTTPQSVTMTNVHVNDSKQFTCIAKNAIGDSEKNFWVKVYQHLQFDKVPQNYTVMVGNPVTMECQVEGPLGPKVTWYKVMPDGSRLVITNGITPTTNGSQLHFEHMDSGKVGQYMCEGNNAVEKVQMSAFLNAYGPPHIVPPGTVTVMKGQKAILRCDTDAHPPATITWSYPPGVTNAYKDTDGTLVILNAQLTDAKHFICKATNPYGTATAQLIVEVKVPAEVRVVPDKIAVGPGTTSIAVECKADGDQPLTVEWYKDGTKLTGNGHVFILSGNVLLINQATTADLGEYTCKVSNSLATASATSLAYSSVGDVKCFDTFTVCTAEVCGAKCPVNCSTSPATISGGPVLYTKVSSLCKAGINSGVITNVGGTVIWRNSNMAVILGVNQTTTNVPP